MSGTSAQRPALEPVWWLGIRLLSLFVRLVTPLRVVGLENLPASGPAVVVANHVSYLDPIVLVVVAHRRGRKMRFLGVREVFERPVVGRLLRIARHIPVGDGPDAMLAIRQARAALARGDLVLIYPEGTIPGTAPVTAAKGGAGLLAPVHRGAGRTDRHPRPGTAAGEILSTAPGRCPGRPTGAAGRAGAAERSAPVRRRGRGDARRHPRPAGMAGGALAPECGCSPARSVRRSRG